MDGSVGPAYAPVVTVNDCEVCWPVAESVAVTVIVAVWPDVAWLVSSSSVPLGLVSDSDTDVNTGLNVGCEVSFSAELNITGIWVSFPRVDWSDGTVLDVGLG